jgi:hypothetical protein
MTTATITNTDTSPQNERVRDTMSLSNILAAPGTATPDITANAPVLAPPTTPTKNDVVTKEEIATPGSVMSDILETEDAVDEIMDDASDEEDVPDSEREFICKNDEHNRCRTGQYSKDLSRKVISDHFGRNKACTRDITDWPLFCRKHYQRATYNKPLWQLRKLALIIRQLYIIEEQFPGTTYDIHFKKSEEARLNAYSRKIACGTSDEAASAAHAPVPGKHFEAPIAILRELDADIGNGKPMDEVKEVVERIYQMIEEKAIDQVPSIEFLPNLPGKSASPKKKLPKTPSPKKPRGPKTPSSKGTPARVSAKGSIKKPGVTA